MIFGNIFKYQKIFDANSISLNDNFDKLVYVKTCIILGLCFLLSANHNYHNREFQCTTPTYMRSYQFIVTFFETQCWASGTIPVRGVQEIPDNPKGWESLEKERLISKVICLERNYLSYFYI